MRRIPRLLLERLHDHPLQILIADRARLSRPRLVIPPVKAAAGAPATPLANRVVVTAQLDRDLLARPSLRSRQHDRQRNANACELVGRPAHRPTTSRPPSESTTSAPTAITAPK